MGNNTDRFIGYVAYCDTHRKQLYSSRKSARKIAKRLHAGHRMAAYECDVHRGLWHIGHMPPVVARGRAERPSGTKRVLEPDDPCYITYPIDNTNDAKDATVARVGTIARVTLQGFDKRGVSSSSAIEDQVAMVYRAARAHATAHKFESYTHAGVHGLRGPMYMSQLIRALFPDLDPETLKTYNSVITQALRRTHACVCVFNPYAGGVPSDRTPEWFIADSMPENLAIVAIGLKHKSADQTGAAQAHEARKMSHTERKLTPHEAGEDRAPGEVTVKTKEPASKAAREKRLAPLRPHHERMAREHQELLDRIVQLITDEQTPVGSTEIPAIFEARGEKKVHGTTVHAAVRELLEAGRLVAREETREESLLRGGGSMPRARRPRLLWPAPGPVPTRTKLPSGITPHVSAAEHARQERERAKTVRQAVVDQLQHHGYSIGELKKHTGHDTDALGVVLKRMVDEGVAYKRNGRYRLTDAPVRHRRTKAEIEAEQQAQPGLNFTADDETPTASRAEFAADNPYLKALADYAATLVTAQAEAIEAASQNGRVQELEAELSKANETIAHLRAALANLS